MAAHISWLTALRFSGWLKMIQPIAPSFSILSLSVMGISWLALHDQAAVDAERLAGHVARARGGEEADHAGHVVRRLHAAQRHRRLALAVELLRCQAEDRALLAR